MFTSDPRDALLLAHKRGRQRREEAATERLRRWLGTPRPSVLAGARLHAPRSRAPRVRHA